MQIICKNVSLGYDSHVVSENIDFAVAQGDYLCIVGENGAGKSTLTKALPVSYTHLTLPTMEAV